jgi:hypothetical protein
MLGTANIATKYHVSWLDQNFADPKRNNQLKRLLFSHIDPQTSRVIPFSEKDKDIDTFIASESQVPGAFENDHFSLMTFTEEKPCLDHIEQVQNHRNLLIASSSLGESAVQKIMERYSKSFVNKNNGKIFSSIYIFCGDKEYAQKWAKD